ncbi:MAG: hypothetical protein WBD28_09070 [Candidatus Zixiibacteriota bacterium]
MKKIFCLFVILFVSAEFSFAQVSVMGSLTQEATLQPGDKIEGKITLQNTAETSWEVTIYKNDYLFYADGSNIYGEPGNTTRSNASWLSVSPKRLIIPSKETASVYFTLEVPENLDLTGTYWSIIMIEPTSEAGPQILEDKETKVKIGVQTKVRYGVQIITNIGDTGAPKISFLDRKLINQDGKKILQMDIENTGNRWLSPTVWVELYNSQGNKVGRFDSDKKRIFPECSVRHRIDLTEVPRGNYKALVVVDNGDQHVFGAKYDLGIE